MQKNIILTGVGGQGTVLASKLIAAAAMAKGLPVMSAETIGMAQKGGAVFSHLRIGEGVKSPMIRRGTADLLLAFEPAEAVRMLPYLRKGGMVVVNSHPIMPVTAALQGTDYTGAEMVAYLREHAEHVLVLDGQKAVEAIGNPDAQRHHARRSARERCTRLPDGRRCARGHPPESQAEVHRAQREGTALRFVAGVRNQR